MIEAQNSHVSLLLWELSPREPSALQCRPLVAAEILQANDNLTQVINLYKQVVKGEEINGETVGGSLRGEAVGGQRGRRGTWPFLKGGPEE